MAAAGGGRAAVGGAQLDGPHEPLGVRVREPLVAAVRLALVPQHAAERVAFAQAGARPSHRLLEQVAALLPPRQLAAAPGARHEPDGRHDGRWRQPQQGACKRDARADADLVGLVGVQRLGGGGPRLWGSRAVAALREGGDALVGRGSGGRRRRRRVGERAATRHVALAGEEEDEAAGRVGRRS